MAEGEFRAGKAVELFTVESLEPRILLSGSPVDVPVAADNAVTVPQNQWVTDSSAVEVSASSEVVNPSSTAASQQVFGTVTALPKLPVSVAPTVPQVSVVVSGPSAPTAGGIQAAAGGIGGSSLGVNLSGGLGSGLGGGLVAGPSVSSNNTSGSSTSSSNDTAVVVDSGAEDSGSDDFSGGTDDGGSTEPSGDPSGPMGVTILSMGVETLRAPGAPPADITNLSSSSSSSNSSFSATIFVGSAYVAPISGSALSITGSTGLRLSSSESLASNVNVSSGGILNGSGTIIGDVTIGDTGVLSPGKSPGIQDIQGNLTLDPTSITEIEIGGLTPGPGSPTVDNGYDQINVTGAVSLGGTLRVTLLNGFTPQIGQTFNIINSTDITGTFSDVEGLLIGDGSLRFEVVKLAGGIQLQVKEVPGANGGLSFSGLNTAATKPPWENIQRLSSE